MLKKIFFLIGLVAYLFLFSLSCNTNNNSILRIAAASNLRYALEELNTEFEKETGMKVEMSAASSGKLTAQIQNGAPFDVFLSANKKYPQFLFKNGFAVNKPKLFCSGLLVYWTDKELDLKGGISEILYADIQRVAIANPQNAPFGQATIQALKTSLLFDSIQSKLIFAENVSQISQYVLNNNVDIGFTGKSIVLSPKMKNKGTWFDVDEKLYQPIEQFVILLKSAEQKKSAQLYYQFLFSKKAQQIFKKYGYKNIDF